MIFKFPVEFEIPDEWWEAAGMPTFQVNSQTYPASSDTDWPTKIVPFTQLVAPSRNKDIPMFVKDRMIGVLRGISQGAVMPPVRAHRPPKLLTGQLQLRDGFHRFYAASAAGYTHLPVAVLPFFDIGSS